MKRSYAVASLLLAATVTGFVAGCGSAGPVIYADGARSIIYKSVDQLAADSCAAVTGRVVRQQMVKDEYGNAITLSSLQIEALVDLPKNEASGAKTLLPGRSVVIRQMGDEAYAQPLSPLLHMNQKYLLFLNPSGLAGDDSKQYFITGNTAGYYQAAGTTRLDGEAIYAKVGNEGDVLPPELSMVEVGTPIH